MGTEEDELEEDVNSIISQLKGENREIKKIEKEIPNLTIEGLEKFILDKAAAVVTHSLDTIESIKMDTIASGEPDAIEAMAQLVKATNSSIDSLSKLKLSNDKIKAQKEIKQMDVEAKTLKNDDSVGNSGLYISREDLLKELVKSASDPEKIENED